MSETSKVIFKNYNLSLMDERDLRLYAQDVRHEYHIKRDQLYRLIQQYYNQSIASHYIKEDDICSLIEECREYKAHYKEISDHITQLSKGPSGDSIPIIKTTHEVYESLYIS